MKSTMRKLLKYVVLWAVGGLAYIVIELMARGHTHWTMFLLGGVCFIALGLINEVLPWSMPLPVQMIIGGAVITLLELVTGCIVNIGLGWAVWDYSALPFNFMGQICLQFSAAWCLLSVVGIVLDDYLRFWWFGEEKPHYRLV